MDSLDSLGQLAAEVAIVVGFLWYLVKRDAAQTTTSERGHEVAEKLAESFHVLKDAIDEQTEVLRYNQRESQSRKGQSQRRQDRPPKE
jgi:hypothetical protein